MSKQPINKQKLERYTNMILHIQEKLTAKEKIAPSTIIKDHTCSPFALQAMLSTKILRRVKPGEYAMGVLHVSEDMVETVIRAVSRKQAEANKNSVRKKKEEEEAKERKELEKERENNNPLAMINDQIKNQQLEEMKQTIEEAENGNGKPVKEPISSGEVEEMNELLREASEIVEQQEIRIQKLEERLATSTEDKQQEIDMLREYLRHVQDRDIQQVNEIKRLKALLNES